MAHRLCGCFTIIQIKQTNMTGAKSSAKLIEHEDTKKVVNG